VKASVAKLKKLQAELDRKDKARYKNLFSALRDVDAQPSTSSA